MTNKKAMEVLKSECYVLPFLDGDRATLINTALNVAIEALKAQRVGKWEIYVISMFDGEGCRCSKCGFEGAPYWNFCPNCGARMEGQE